MLEPVTICVGLYEPVTITDSASDGLAAVAGVGEGDERAVASCPRELAAVEIAATKQDKQRRVIDNILSGFPRVRDNNKPIE